ncbi:MAG: SDR family oxidoreductase [Candidatus Nanopelagicaceae bacterium]|nr:SDR family oxidoreductase [Candidatus Nanopelagicaceae bacterium]
MSAASGGHTCVIVTGGGSGIGLATARHLLEDWSDVKIVSADLRIGEIEKVQEEFGKDRVLFVEANVSSPESAAELVATTVAWADGVSGLVNCAGNSTNVSSLEMTPAQWREVMDVHIDGHFYMNQAVARHMVASGKGGAIVNFSSIAHIFGWPRRLPYAVSKAGIDALTRTLAVEWAEFGIRVNAIAPGYINTPLVVNATARGYLDPTIVGMHAMGRFGEPNEIATGVKFLLSDDASFITGEILTIDGGFSVKKIPWNK